MKIFAGFFLVLGLLLPSMPNHSFAQALPEDCAVCGHACCCPEMCKPLIKKMKACDQPDSLCHLQSTPTSRDLNFKSESECPNSRFLVLSYVAPLGGNNNENVNEAFLYLNFSVWLNILTPPPKPFIS